MNDRRDPSDPASPPPEPPPSWWERLSLWWHPPEHLGFNRLDLTWERFSLWYQETPLGGWLAYWHDRIFNRTFDETLQFWQWLSRWQTLVGLAISLALFLMAAGWAVYGGRHWYRQREEHRLAAQAGAMLAKGDLRHAYFCAQMGLRINADNPDTLRVMAALMAMTGNTNALYWGKRVLAINPDFTNQLALAAVALRVEANPFPTAAATLNAIPPARQQNPEYQRLAGSLALQLGQIQTAVEHFTQLVQLEPANWTNQLQLAAIELHSTKATNQAAAIASLQHLTEAPQSRMDAWRLLVAHHTEQKEWAQAESFGLQLAAQPEANISDHIALLTILQARHNPALTNHLVQAEAQAGTNYQAVMDLADWMNQHGCAQFTLNWLSHQPAGLVQQGALPATTAEAYASLGEWHAMEKFLLHTNWPNLEPFRQAYLARAAEQLEQSRESETAWVLAFSQAAVSADDLRILAQMTQAWNWSSRQENLLWLTAERYPNQNWSWPVLTRLVEQKKDTRRMWRLAKLLYEQHPEDDQMANDYAAYSLLINADLSIAQDLAMAIHLRHPDDAIMATTYALAELKVGATNAALAAFQKLSPALLETPVVAAYYGITLAVCGDQTNARTYLDRSLPARLLPEEAALVALAKSNPQQLVAELVPSTTSETLLSTIKALPPESHDTRSRWTLAKISHLMNRADVAAGSQYAILSLLLKSDLGEAYDVAATLYQQHPTNQACIIAYAFSLLNQGQTNEALALFTNPESGPWSDSSAPIYYGLALAANGKMSQARSQLLLATKIPMSPEEQQLVQCASQSSAALLAALLPAPSSSNSFRITPLGIPVKKSPQ